MATSASSCDQPLDGVSTDEAVESLTATPLGAKGAAETAFSETAASGDASHPPVDYIIVRETSVPTPVRLAGSSAASTPRGQRPVHKGSTARPALSLSSSPGSPFFRLAPRRSGNHFSAASLASRGRKRSAASISSSIFSAADSSRCADKPFSLVGSVQDGATATSTAFSESAAASPGVARAFQGLSLASPDQQATSTSSLDGSSHLSLGGNQSHFAKSSFSKYTGSPSGSFQCPPSSGSAETPNNQASKVSSSAASPRIAPLTVLNNGDRRPSARTLKASGPPMLCTLDGGDKHDSGFATPKLPPSMVHCRHSASSSDSYSTINGGDDNDSSYRNRTCRELFAETSPSRRSVTSISDRTPLPKVSLTPRSQSSSHSDQNFPSPSEVDIEFESPFHPTHSRSSAMETTTGSPHVRRDSGSDSFGFFVDGQNVQSSPPERLGRRDPLSSHSEPPPNRKKPESFIPLPDWGESTSSSILQGTSVGFENNKMLAPLNGPVSRSLLHPSTSQNSMLAILESTHRSAEQRDADFGSLCASEDDDDAFVLVAPSTVLAEREESQHPTKQRRLSKCKASVTSLASSNASLLGMGFVASSTSLPAMDLPEGHLKRTASSRDSFRRSSHSPTSLHRDASSLSIGLALEPTTSDRDLVTPPTTTHAHSPPPLSPRPGHLMRTAAESTSSKVPSLCVSDRS